MSSPALVDVVIPCWNEQRRITACIDSICQSDELVHSIIVIDQFSSDATAAIVEKLAEVHPKIRLLQYDGPTRAAQRNFALQHCEADSVLFLDGHVVLSPRWLTTLHEQLQQASRETAAIASPIIYRCESPTLQRYFDCYTGFSKQRFFEIFLSGRCDPLPWLPSGAVLFRRSALSAVGGFDESLAELEDIDLSWRLVLQGFQLAFCPSEIAEHFEDRSFLQVAKRLFHYGLSLSNFSQRYGYRAGFGEPIRLSELLQPSILALQLSFLVGALISCLKTRKLAAANTLPLPPQSKLAWYDSATLYLAPGVIFWHSQEDGSETIIQSIPQSRRATLSGSASYIWWSLLQHQDLQAALTSLEQRFEVSRAELETDICSLVEDLVEDEFLHLHAHSALVDTEPQN